MFAAVALFVILLLAILYIAFMRFGDPPPPTPIPEAPTAMYHRRPSMDSAFAIPGAARDLHFSPERRTTDV